MANLEKLKRIPYKIKRNFLQLPVLKLVFERAYEQELNKYVGYLPKIYPEDENLIKSLHHEGVFLSSLQNLGIRSTSSLIVSAKKLLPEFLAFSTNNQCSFTLPSSILMKYPEIFLWGLEERIINIVENYIGLPVLYHGVDFRREIANEKLADVRQWHLDVEDYRMVKIIVYLNDVSIKGGPFEYISKTLTSALRQNIKYSGGFIPDQIIEDFVPRSDWKPCIGDCGTIIFSDTCNVFHRAKPPVESDRFSMTFAYTSRQPITMFSKSALPMDELRRISSRLSRRQRECILGFSD
ncbi:MAG: 2OG-Fe(II) oxygenase [Chlorogloeopsis fritschii C42_A2020_084]|jgi:hypothetical protein|uniref:hypothetical protein n=1 Tax=Chlorogloeopsis fritschii TaxID=1124 RepID=UPI0019FB5B37|nr:hypothetical protein [Chlorogloeopsis fritschii]MBF2007509.1 2OG-Fe(II) oxygenase [Chlorogloeopsis fritschii C42_A2020_084]